jgi:uncharacterized phage protein (TIGR02220 family)
MEYSFDVDLATKYGVDEAIMIKSFQYWIRLNKANKSNFHDGHYWTYNTIKSLSSLFPFWSEKQVRTVLQNLLNRKILMKGNYNKMGFDRTIWYAFTNENEFLTIPKKENASAKIVNSNLPNSQMDITEQENGTYQTVNTIPITNTITNSNINSIIEEKKDFEKSSSKPKKQIENIEDVPYFFELNQILDLLSERTGAKYNLPKTVATLKKYQNYTLVKSLLENGHSLEQVFKVIEFKCKEWLPDAKMCTNLVPSVLFRQSNFENYIIQSQIKSVNNNQNNQKNGNRNYQSEQEIRQRSVTNIIEMSLNALNEQEQFENNIIQSLLNNQKLKS